MLSSLSPFQQRSAGPELGQNRRFAFRIECDRVILVIATCCENEPVDVQVDYIRLTAQPDSMSEEIESGEFGDETLDNAAPTSRSAREPQTARMNFDWMLGDGWKRLRDAIDTLATRHKIGGESVAVSLTGDFCVTRISTGTVDDVEQKLGALAGRIPRYLQLGPGGKLIGQVRETLSPGIDHALTAVGNFTRLNALYEAFVSCHVDVAWIEPSLVSMARMVGMLGIDSEKPVLIADSFGQSWEVGITHQGRLLLDYRPAAAHDAQTFAIAIDQHLARLRRFCQRHRGMTQSELSDLYVGGPPEKVDTVITHFGPTASLSAKLFQLPESCVSVRVPKEIESDAIAAFAAILPLTQPDFVQNPPDLLQTIRRDRAQSKIVRAVLTVWPIAVAAVLLMTASLWVGSLRDEAEQKHQQRQFVEVQMRATQARMASLQSDRRWVQHLGRIEQQTVSPPIVDLTTQITQCLPPQAALTSIRFDVEHNIMLTGKTSNEAEIYEIVGYLRRITGINQVALLATTSGVVQGESQFEMRLSWLPERDVDAELDPAQES
ncbi:hypothetical protein FHS27_000377 [Rhodopirellula rubra]|uniref:Uncharacterized protein n=1 Tax=Aporhodopirellula rubra TaxID=980271 RepID=A0A7W5DV28_9BACT|nr:hypothetical protein [Aporhodopirellula rubra]MBB3204613.1 hypothetical protein [Aporhodopirellula rubra]